MLSGISLKFNYYTLHLSHALCLHYVQTCTTFYPIDLLNISDCIVLIILSVLLESLIHCKNWCLRFTQYAKYYANILCQLIILFITLACINHCRCWVPDNDAATWTFIAPMIIINLVFTAYRFIFHNQCSYRLQWSFWLFLFLKFVWKENQS